MFQDPFELNRRNQMPTNLMPKGGVMDKRKMLAGMLADLASGFGQQQEPMLQPMTFNPYAR